MKRCYENVGNDHFKMITTGQAVECVLNESEDELDLKCDYSGEDIKSELDNHLDNEE
uniref:Uncharacterized protein n=1 Tax=Arion vulgaris TaxID=1028688 RepID=A0A0B7AKM8_9EUPU